MGPWILVDYGKGVICTIVESLRGLENIHCNNQPVFLPEYFFRITHPGKSPRAESGVYTAARSLPGS